MTLPSRRHWQYRDTFAVVLAEEGGATRQQWAEAKSSNTQDRPPNKGLFGPGVRWTEFRNCLRVFGRQLVVCAFTLTCQAYSHPVGVCSLKEALLDVHSGSVSMMECRPLWSLGKSVLPTYCSPQRQESGTVIPYLFTGCESSVMMRGRCAALRLALGRCKRRPV